MRGDGSAAFRIRSRSNSFRRNSPDSSPSHDGDAVAETDEFLNLGRNHEDTGPPSASRWIHW